MAILECVAMYLALAVCVSLRGVVWCGVVWCGVVWCGVVWWYRWVFVDRENQKFGQSWIQDPDQPWDALNVIPLVVLLLPQLLSYYNYPYAAIAAYMTMAVYFCILAVSERVKRISSFSSVVRTLMLVTGTYPNNSIGESPELQSGFSYLSDGGFYENLGILHLLQVGMTRIFCFDCNEDPNRQMSSLVTVLDTAKRMKAIKCYEILENPLDIVPRMVSGVLISAERCLTIKCTLSNGNESVIYYCKVPASAAAHWHQ
jgi:hypothetical protein